MEKCAVTETHSAPRSRGSDALEERRQMIIYCTTILTENGLLPKLLECGAIIASLIVTGISGVLLPGTSGFQHKMLWNEK